MAEAPNPPEGREVRGHPKAGILIILGSLVIAGIAAYYDWVRRLPKD